MIEFDMNSLDNTPNQPTKFRAKSWVERNDKSRGTYSTNSQIKFKTSMLRSSVCDYSHTYVLVSGTIEVTALATCGGNNDIQVVFADPVIDFPGNGASFKYLKKSQVQQEMMVQKMLK